MASDPAPRQVRRRGLLRVVGYIALALASVVLERGEQLFSFMHYNECNRIELTVKMLYQRFATAAHRKPRPHFVTLVVLSQASEPHDVLANPCKKREFASELLRRIAEAGPSMIVLDFWYPPDSCAGPQDTARTRKLQEAVKDVSTTTPIVVAIDSQTEHELQLRGDAQLPELKRAGFTSADQILSPAVHFDGKDVHYGLARFNCDTRRLPLFWQVYISREDVWANAPRQRLPSLAYIAASTYDAQLPSLLSQINTNDEHPFTSFIPVHDFKVINSIDILCGRRLGAEEDWKACSSSPNAVVEVLRGSKIVLVGERTEQDHHNTVMGDMPGYALHANYIEALLDDRYFRPVPFLLEWALSLAGVVLIIGFVEFSSSFFRAFLHSTGFVVIVAIACNLLSLYSGYFLAFWLPLVPIVIVELVYGWRVRAMPISKEEAH